MEQYILERAIVDKLNEGDQLISQVSFIGVGINENGSLQTFDISSCWVSAQQTEDQMDSANDTATRTIKQEEQ